MNTDFATDILRQECMKPSHEETSEKHPLIIPICFLWEKIKLVTSVLQFLVSLKKGTLYHKSGCLLYLSPVKKKKKNTRGSLTFYAKMYIIELYIIRILQQAVFSKEIEWMRYFMLKCFNTKFMLFSCSIYVRTQQNLETV